MAKESGRHNLLRNDFLYRTCRAWAASLVHAPDRQLSAIADAAYLAWQHHPGRFADGALENHLLRLGRERDPPHVSRSLARVNDLSRATTTLHVATELYATGGHSRILAKWSRRDTSANHIVVLTRQTSPVPEFFEREIAEAKGVVVVLPPAHSSFERADALRNLSMQCDRVILHSHPHDLVPILAFARAGGPPVAMFNHAHFGFSLGPSVADLVLNTFDYFRAISEQHRFARRTGLLTVVSGVAPVTDRTIDKEASKIAIGADPSQCVALAGGHESYFAPIAGYNFFRTARRLLDENRHMQLVLMGVRRDSALVPATLRDEPRCQLVGPVGDPVPYYRAADLCLESFPMPSLGVVAEAVAQGEAFPVPVYGADEGILRVSQVPLLSYRYRPKDEDDYVAYVSRVSSNLGDAREEAREARSSLCQIDEGWGSRLGEINQEIDQLRHMPEELPSTSMNDSDDSRLLADLSPLDVGGGIDQFLPFREAVGARIAAAQEGHLTPVAALRGLGRRVTRGLKSSVGRSARRMIPSLITK